MKVQRGRIIEIGLLLIILLGVQAAAVSPPLDHTVVRIFFEKDGVPCNESVNFSITCYGMDCDGKDCRESTRARLAESGQVIYSGIYAGYGSIRSITTSPFTGIYTRCDLAGTAAGENFSIENYSVSPFGDCIDIRKNYGKFYYQAPEYEQCVAGNWHQQSLCDSYATTCNPTEGDCIRLITGRYGRDTVQFRSCTANASRSLQSCSSFLKKMDSDIIIMWNDSRDFQSVPDLQCDLRLAIPPDNMTPSASVSSVSPAQGTIPVTDQPLQGITYGARAVAKARSNNPIETLYCRIQQFLGGKCD